MLLFEGIEMCSGLDAATREIGFNMAIVVQGFLSEKKMYKNFS